MSEFPVVVFVDENCYAWLTKPKHCPSEKYAICTKRDVQRLVEALESCLAELWDDKHSHMSREAFDEYFEDEIDALRSYQEWGE